jgi:hypothetical protein
MKQPDEWSDEAMTTLLNMIDISKALKTKSNAEIAELIMVHILADMPIGTAQEGLLSEAVDRLLASDPPPPGDEAA